MQVFELGNQECQVMTTEVQNYPIEMSKFHRSSKLPQVFELCQLENEQLTVKDQNYSKFLNFANLKFKVDRKGLVTVS
jgi:hypothetical protein